jgi:hypothetical protein
MCKVCKFIELLIQTSEIFEIIDYRIYAPDQDGKTKNEHFSEMVINTVSTKKIEAKRILFDSWYASA